MKLALSLPASSASRSMLLANMCSARYELIRNITILFAQSGFSRMHLLVLYKDRFNFFFPLCSFYFFAFSSKSIETMKKTLYVEQETFRFWNRDERKKKMQPFSCEVHILWICRIAFFSRYSYFSIHFWYFHSTIFNIFISFRFYFPFLLQFFSVVAFVFCRFLFYTLLFCFTLRQLHMHDIHCFIL